jgi:hypothetical protein
VVFGPPVDEGSHGRSGFGGCGRGGWSGDRVDGHALGDNGEGSGEDEFAGFEATGEEDIVAGGASDGDRAEGEVVVGGGDGDAIAGEERAAGDADDVFERAALEGSVDVEAWGDERVWFGAWGEFDGDWERAAGAVDFCGGADEGGLD